MLSQALRFLLPTAGLLGVSVAPVTAHPAAAAFTTISARPAATGAPNLLSRSAAAPVETVLSTFTFTTGTQPLAGLVADAKGNLYGTAYYSGNYNTGTVFELSPPTAGQTAWTKRVIYYFGSCGTANNLNCDGYWPKAGLVFDRAGNLYGTTAGGGAYRKGATTVLGDGVVFKLSPSPTGTAWRETVLHVFTGGADGGTSKAGLAIDAAGALYGTTEIGGAPGVCGVTGTGGLGVVFKLTPPHWTETVVHTFTGTGGDGACPIAGLLLDSSGALYGTTPAGGKNRGIVFKLTPGKAGYTEQVLWDFYGPNDLGGSPAAGLIQDGGGDLYGTTPRQVFKLSPPTKTQPLWTETILHTFTGQPDGSYCVSGLAIDSSGSALYGTTAGGGVGPYEGGGTIFEIKPPAIGKSLWTESVLHAFTWGNDGAQPVAGLVPFGNVLYGTTQFGGNSINGGTIFAIKP